MANFRYSTLVIVMVVMVLSDLHPAKRSCYRSNWESPTTFKKTVSTASGQSLGVNYIRKTTGNNMCINYVMPCNAFKTQEIE